MIVEDPGPLSADAAVQRFRHEIERLDRELVLLIAKRVAIARDAGRAKREHGLPTLDPAREAAVVRRSAELARDAGLEPEAVRQIFWQLIGLCRRVQNDGS